jgi:hypothetical protein
MEAKELYKHTESLHWLGDMLFSQAIELAKAVTMAVDHDKIRIISVSDRRIKYVDGAEFEGQLIEQFIRFDALHPKQFLLLIGWGYDLFGLMGQPEPA